MKIRKINKKDYEIVDKLVGEAFASAQVASGQEVKLVHEIRESKNYLPEYEFVAIEDDKIVGHFMMSILPFEDAPDEVLLLAPVSVAPEYQHKGIGTKMLKEGIKRVKNKGYFGLVVEGDPGFYHPVGFRVSTEYGICGANPEEMPSEENLMALELIDSGLDGFFGEADFSIYKNA